MKPNRFALLALVTVAGCHFGDSPGYLGKIAERADGTLRGDAGPTDSAADGGGSAPRAGEDGARVPPRLTVSVSPLPGEVCPGECVMLLAHANGGEGDVAFDWFGDVAIRGAGPHRVCPTRDASYLVVASDGRQRANATAMVRIRDYCDAAEDDAGAGGEPDSGGPPSDWPMLGYDVAGTSFNRAERVLTKANVANLRERFVLELEAGMYGPPLLVGSKLYINAGHHVRAHELATGAEIWRFELGAGEGDVTRNSLAYDAGRVFLLQQNAIAIALNAETGEMVWLAEHAADETEMGLGSPIVVGDAVVFGRSSDRESVSASGVRSRGILTSRQKRDGALLWENYALIADQSGAGIASTPAADLALGFVYTTTTAPAIDVPESMVAVELDPGTVRFTRPLAAEAARPRDTSNGLERGANSVLYTLQENGPPLDVVVAGTHACFLTAMTRDTGVQLWSSEIGPGAGGVALDSLPNAAWSGESVLVSCNESPGRNTARLVALEGRTGAMLWERQFNSAVLGRITVANGVGFVGAGASLEVFDVETGDSLRSIPTGGSTAFSVASIANGVVAFAIGAQADGSAAGAKVLVYSVGP